VCKIRYYRLQIKEANYNMHAKGDVTAVTRNLFLHYEKSPDPKPELFAY
jgi:hypothetical protein